MVPVPKKPEMCHKDAVLPRTGNHTALSQGAGGWRAGEGRRGSRGEEGHHNKGFWDKASVETSQVQTDKTMRHSRKGTACAKNWRHDRQGLLPG